MKTCPKCNKELKDTAKFCGGCGYKLPDMTSAPAVEVSATCPRCGNALKPSAKFCGKCGHAFAAVAQPDGKNLERVGNSGFIRWTMLPGQVAVKITESEIEACGKIKGISIQEGTKALFFVNGKLTAELEAGNYEFNDLGVSETAGAGPARTGGFINFLKERCARAWQTIVGSPNKAAVSVVLVRSTEFPLVFLLKDANTMGVRSDVGLHLLCKVANINEFYQKLLLDRKFVSFDQMQKELHLIVANQVNLAVASCSPDQVRNNPTLVQDMLGQLQSVVGSVYPFVSVARIILLAADNQALEAIRKMAEELYVSEQELVQLQKRNDFLNRLQAVKNSQELTEGRQGADFEAQKLEIYKQMELTKDEQSKFDLMLAADKKLREAKTEEEIAAAMQEYHKTGLLRDQELDRIRRQGRMADLRDTQEYDMTALRGELAQKRVQDEYNDDRREKNAAFEDARRRSEIQLDREEQQSQLDMLRQAQAIRIEREDAEHRRAMEVEKLKVDAKLEGQRIYAGMTFEQIMAANPDISPDAAKALAQKFSSEGKDELLKAREADMERQSAQQMEMMRMMQQMAMAGIGAKQAHQDEMIAAKQAELERARDDASLNQDRLLSGVQATVTAAGVAFSGNKAASQGRPPVRKEAGSHEAPVGRVCSKCGAALEPGASFCGECGTAL